MYSFLYNLYFKKFNSKSIDELNARVFTRIMNYILPIYFRSTRIFFKHKGNEISKTKGEKYIVSLTTFPARVNKVWITIESILRQKTKPDSIILWLCKEEFIDKEVLPKNLLLLEKYGLQIRMCPDKLMPHTKYFYSIKEYPDANIITIDDDIIYPPLLLENLIKKHKQFPNCICSTLTRNIETIDGQLQPYDDWKCLRISTIPSSKLLMMGVGGVLYPPYSLNNQVFSKEMIKEKALFSDDLWLKAMSLLNNSKVLSVAGEYTRFFIPLFQNTDQRLAHLNIGQGLNDKVFVELLNYYNISISDLNVD